MKELLKNKFLIIVTISVGFAIAIIFIFGGHTAIKATSGERFCNSCHSWMNPMAETYNMDVHGGMNSSGIRAQCVNCHLPQDSLIANLAKKGVNGIVEVTSMLVNDPKDMDWQKHREKRETYVFDSGCLSCHKKIETTVLQSEQAKIMHEKYSLYKNADTNPLSCVSCHKNVGHKGLSKKLYDLTHEPIGEWPEDIK